MSVAAIPNPEADEAAADAIDEAAEASTEQAEETAPVEGEAPAEGEPKPEGEAAKPVEIPEEQLKVAAEKFAADLVKRANTTMAAARRAEARTEAVKAENTKLKATAEEQRGHLEYAGKFVERLRSGDPTCFAELGMTVRQWLDLAKDFGEAKPETAETRLERLERERKEEREAAAKREHEAGVEAARKQVFGIVDADKSRWRMTATPTGHALFWGALGDYWKLHGSVPDEMVPLIADAVEKDMRAEFGEPASAPRPGVPNGAPPAAGRNTKTLTSKGASAAPGVSEYSLDPDERREQVNARLRADGLL